jgi:hypothetical protein
MPLVCGVTAINRAACCGVNVFTVHDRASGGASAKITIAKITYIHSIYMVLANPVYEQSLLLPFILVQNLDSDHISVVTSW